MLSDFQDQRPKTKNQLAHMSQPLTKIEPLYQPVDLDVAPATFSADVEAEIDRHLAKYPVRRSAILPLMFVVQRERGYLDPAGVLYLANRLGFEPLTSGESQLSIR